MASTLVLRVKKGTHLGLYCRLANKNMHAPNDEYLAVSRRRTVAASRHERSGVWRRKQDSAKMRQKGRRNVIQMYEKTS
jgi:hypothetical protein